MGSSQHSIRLKLARAPEDLPARLRELEGVDEVNASTDGAWLIQTESDIREHIARATIEFGLLELTSGSSLKDLYLRTTSGGEA